MKENIAMLTPASSLTGTVCWPVFSCRLVNYPSVQLRLPDTHASAMLKAKVQWKTNVSNRDGHKLIRWVKSDFGIFEQLFKDQEASGSNAQAHV